jgi:hypothetical protein
MQIKFHKKNLSDMDKVLLNQIGKLKGNQWTGYYLDIPSSEEWRFRVGKELIYYNNCPILCVEFDDTKLYPQEICQAVTKMGTFKEADADLANERYIAQQILDASNHYLVVRHHGFYATCPKDTLDKLVSNNPKIKVDSHSKNILDNLVSNNPKIIEKYFDEAAKRGIYQLRKGVNLKDEIQDAKDSLVPDSIKTAILKLIEDRITKIDSTRGAFKYSDKSKDKANALQTLKQMISGDDEMSVSQMLEAIKTWRTGNKDTIEDARNRMAIFKSPTKTQKMIEDIEDTLQSVKSLKGTR